MSAGAIASTSARTRGVNPRAPKTSPKMIDRCTPVCTISPGASTAVATYVVPPSTRSGPTIRAS
jgi:hypothetical protein